MSLTYFGYLNGNCSKWSDPIANPVICNGAGNKTKIVRWPIFLKLHSIIGILLFYLALVDKIWK